MKCDEGDTANQWTMSSVMAHDANKLKLNHSNKA